MTDKNSSPHITALQEMEAALDAHRRTQAPAGATDRAQAQPHKRRFALRWPRWLLLFDPRILLGVFCSGFCSAAVILFCAGWRSRPACWSRWF
jgi:hypothetical protein